MAKILISGGSGMLGKVISKKLMALHHEVVWLSRTAGQWQGVKIYAWHPEKGTIDEQALDGVAHLIHLAGAGVMNKRWTKAYRDEIVNSRVDSMLLLCKTFAKTNSWPQSAVGASASGYYGGTISAKIVDEQSSSGDDFLAEVCRAWEKSYSPLSENGCRTSIARLGVILSSNGGALAPLKKLCAYHLSAITGSGKQYFPWVHVEDAANFFIAALFTSSYDGKYNLVAPDRISNKQFAKTLTLAMNKKTWLPAAPEWILKLVLGERANALTKGANIVPSRLLAQDFEFHFPKIDKALQDLID